MGAAPERQGAVPERWSSDRDFILAATGAVIGFSNFWQFPHIVAQHGGGAFLVVYLACVALIGLPLLLAEILLGRSGRASPVGTFRHLAGHARRSPRWALVGGMGVLSGFLIFSYLSVIAGWTIAYSFRAAFNAFSGLTADGVAGLFAALVKDPEKQLFWHTCFIVATMLTAARGLRAGLEAATRVVMPLILLLLLALLAYAATLGSFPHALAHLLAPDFTRLGATGVLTAMAHAFFTLGLGAGVMLMYGAYTDAQTPLPRAALWIVGLDTAAGLVAGVVIFAVLFGGGVEPVAGTALVFRALPLALDHLPFGGLAGTLFFALLALVAWLSALAFVEPALVWLGERFALPRRRAALLLGAAAWLLGVAVILSFNLWAFSFKFFGVVKKLGGFDVLQIVTAHALLPLAGILIALFAGWAFRPSVAREALGLRSPCTFEVWLWLVRLVVPALLAVVWFNLPELFA